MRMSIGKRKVFYLGGFDPRGARHYYQLCLDAAKPQGAQVSARQGEQWQVALEGTTADYEFLGWDDIVRTAWIRSPLRLVWRVLGMYAAYLRHLRWGVFLRLATPPAITFLYPLALLILVPILLFLVGNLLLPWPVAAALAVLLATGILHISKGLWLLRFFVFNHQVATENDPALEARLGQFAARIRASFAQEYDEVLLLAHSNGSILGTELLEKLHALGGWPPHFRFVTLGQCIPIVSLLRTATRLHAAQAALAGRTLYWCDIGFPPDGACWARKNTFLPQQPGPGITLKLLSPRFFRYYQPARYRQLLRNKYQLHFAYLFSGDQPSPVDFIALVAGPHALPDSVAMYEAA